MGWKSTVEIKRSEALYLIQQKLNECSDRELSNILTDMGYGDKEDYGYFGHNFIVTKDEDFDKPFDYKAC